MNRCSIATLTPVLVAGVLTASAARADTTTPDNNPTYRPVEHERRAGLVVGGGVGVGLAGASGYTNNVKYLGNPDYYSATPLLVGVSQQYFLMGALTDYLSFGPLVSIATFDTPSWRSTGFGIGFRLEVFPLASLAPSLADTAVYGQAGIGSTRIAAKGPYPDADGTRSFLGLGLHHELRLARLLGGHAAAGPFLEYDAIYAESAQRHWGTLGLRLAWYGGTVKQDQR